MSWRGNLTPLSKKSAPSTGSSFPTLGHFFWAYCLLVICTSSVKVNDKVIKKMTMQMVCMSMSELE